MEEDNQTTNSNSKWIEYRELFITEYGYNKQHLLETIKNGIMNCNKTQLTEIIKLISFDDEKWKDQFMNGNCSIDLRWLHCETIFHIWVYLKEVILDSSVTALFLKSCLCVE